MAFTFGATPSAAPGPSFGTAAPAPAFGSSFGAAPAPATGGGFSFGGAAAQHPAPSAATGGFSFAAAPTAPQAAPGSASTFSFGAPAAAAFSPAPAAATGGFSFGGGGGSTMFGAPAPAPIGGGAFGYQPAAAPAAAAFAPQPPLSGVSGSMPYASLPPQYKAVIDKIHEAMMTHQRTMINLKSMGPRPLMLASRKSKNNYNKESDEALPKMIQNLHGSLNTLQQQVEDALATALRQRDECGQSVQQTYFYAKWPTEAMASRRGVRLTNPPNSSRAEEKKDAADGGSNSTNNIQEQVREMLNRQMASVDRIERMPSPYFWQVLDDMQQRTAYLMDQTMQLQNQLSLSRTLDPSVTSVRSVVESQDASLVVLGRKLHAIHLEMEKIRQAYIYFERGENVLEKAELEALQRQNKYDEQIQMQFLRSMSEAPSSSSAPGAASASTSSFSTGAFGAASAPGTTFGAAPAPAPGAFSFGTPAPAAGGAPVAGAPSSGFGATAGTGFAATTAFGATTFGATTPANKSNKKNTRNAKGRLGR